MSNSVEPPTSRPSRLASKPGDQPLLAEDQRHPLGAAALERLAVARPGERDDRVVAVLRAAALDRGQRRVLVAQLLEDLVDPGVVDGLDLGPEVEVLVVAELDLGRHLDGRLEDERLALLGLDDLDIGVRQRQEVLLDHRLAIGVARPGARPPRRGSTPGPRWRSRTGRGALPGRKPGTRVPRDRRRTASSMARLSRSGRKLDLEQDGGFGAGGGGDLHRPSSIRGSPAGEPLRRTGPGVRLGGSPRTVVGERGIEPPRRFRGTGS